MQPTPLHAERLLQTRSGPVRCLGPAPLQHGQVALLLVHGIGARAEVWHPVLPLLRGMQAIAIDLPGHGHSPGPLHATADAYARCVEDVRIALGLPAVFVVGQSLGGAIAQCYAHDFHASCRGIVIANSAAGFAIGEDRLRHIEDDWPAAARDFAARQLSEGASEALKEQARRMVAWRDPAVLAHDMRTCNAFSSHAWAASISRPVLILTGDADKTTGPARAAELQALYPHADLRILSPCGHNAVLEQPERFAAEIAAFVAKHAPQ